MCGSNYWVLQPLLVGHECAPVFHSVQCSGSHLLSKFSLQLDFGEVLLFLSLHLGRDWLEKGLKGT